MDPNLYSTHPYEIYAWLILHGEKSITKGHWIEVARSITLERAIMVANALHNANLHTIKIMRYGHNVASWPSPAKVDYCDKLAEEQE